MRESGIDCFDGDGTSRLDLSKEIARLQETFDQVF